MVSLLTLTGGASLASVLVYRRWEKRAKVRPEQPWWQASWQSVQGTLHQVRQCLPRRHPHPSVVIPPMTAHLWQVDTVCTVPTTTLQPGDQVLLKSGEMMPVDGLIIEGVAWVRPQALSATACGLRKSVGSRVMATDIVMVGRICVQVLSPAGG